MKRKTIQKIFFCTFALTTLLLAGCSQKDNQRTQNSSPSTNTTQSTSQSQSGTVQNSGDERNMISEEDAREIALIHAGLTADSVTFISSDIDRDDNRKKYDVEFYTQDNREYDYEIDPYTGDILEADSDVESYSH